MADITLVQSSNTLNEARQIWNANDQSLNQGLTIISGLAVNTSGTDPIDVTNNVVSLVGISGFGTSGQVLKVHTNGTQLEWGTDTTLSGRLPLQTSNSIMGLVGISGFGTSSQILKVSATEDALEWADDTDTTYTAQDPITISGATISLASLNSYGTSGQVLKVNATEDGLEWANDTDTDTTYTVQSPLTLNGTVISLASLNSYGTYGQILKVNIAEDGLEWSDDTTNTYTGANPVTVSGTVVSLATISGFGSSGQVLKVNATEDGLEWASDINYSPAGNNTQIQFNDNGSFGASSNLTWDGSVLSSLAFDTNVAAAQLKLSTITLEAEGTDVNIDINITPKGAGEVNIPKVDIDDGDISGTDITVGAGKTLDISAGTLTLADNQISGDKIEGGTISAITIQSLTSNSIAVDNITIDGNDISSTDVNGNITLTPNGTGKVGVQEASPTSTLHLGGSIAVPISTKTNDYSLTTSDHIIILNGASNTVTGTLPDATTCSGRIYNIKAIDITNTASVDTTGGQLIDGSLTYTFTYQYESITVASTGAQWVVI